MKVNLKGKSYIVIFVKFIFTQLNPQLRTGNVFLLQLSKVNRCDINSVDSNRKQGSIAVNRRSDATFACRKYTQQQF